MRQIGFFRGLSGRLIVAFIGVIIIIMLVLAGTVPQIARTYQINALEGRLIDEAQMVADYVASELVRGSNDDIDVLAKRLGQRARTRITIIALDGTVIGESHQDLSQVDNHAGRREVLQAISQGQGVDLHLSQTVGYEMLYVAVPIFLNDSIYGTARTALPLSEVNLMVNDMTQAIMLTAISGGLLAIIVAILAARAINKPLAELTQMAAALARNPLHTGVVRRNDGPAEVALLSRTLDRMTIAIQDSLRRVEAERDRLDTILANLTDGVVVINEHGQIALLNAAARRLLGIEKQEVSGNTVAEVLRDHELIEMVEKMRLSPIPTSIETRLLELPKPRRSLMAAVSRFGPGQESQTLMVLQDLTELQRLETVRRDFVANVSHELRTPIASIKIMTETLQDGAIEDQDAARDFLSRIEEEVDGLHQMVEELLELSRLESGRVGFVLAPIDPGTLVENGVRRLAAMAERAGVALKIDVQPDLPDVLADANRMDQVLVNLIHNGIKFTPPGGVVTVRAAVDGNNVRLSVTDTGSGIDPELLPRIFERFFKADQARASGGTGLGLAIAKHSVQLHSGRIWAESSGPGRGMTVHIILPCAPIM